MFGRESVLPLLAVELTPDELPVGVTNVKSSDWARMVFSWSGLATRLIW